MRELLLQRVELAGRPEVDVLLAGGRVAAIGPTGTLSAGSGAERLDGAGGALLRGLHDHHLHLFATAAADTSVACGPPAVNDLPGLRHALRAAAASRPPGGWVRGVGYDPEITGELSASDLDALLGPFADRPVRLAHRSGHAWLLNRQARAQLGLGPGGLLLDDDDRIRAELGGEVPLLAHVSRRLARAGVTGVTDAGVHNGAAELAALRAASGRGELLQRCLVLGGEELPRADDDSLVGTGALKIVLAEHDLPGLDDLVDRIARAGPRLVAVHTVTLPTLVLALAALASPRAGGRLGHRLEHAAVAPPDLVQEGRRLGVRVVTQPAFVLRHGDRYHRTVEAQDRPWLYRLRGWREAGVPLAAGSDAPYGPEDPWISMRAAVERRTGGGAVLGQAEALSPEEALALFTSPARAPGSTRPLRVGDVADLCLLSLPWSQARQVLDAGTVRASVVAGRLAYLDATQR